MKKIDFSKSILHDSAQEKYRQPLGAATAGTRVTLRLRMRGFHYESAYLTLLRGMFKIEIEMRREQDGMLYAEYDTPAEPGVIWYYFTIHLDGKNKIYYGPAAGGTCGVGKVYWSVPPAYQLTVFDGAFTTPHWFKGAVMYQIFPDRFCCGNPEKMKQGLAYHRRCGRRFTLHESWDEMPRYRAEDGAQFYQPCDFYGGDIEGIIAALDDLQEMGVSVLYLNPVFEAASNHRYNTGDYLKIDPILGTNEDFERLTELANMRGIRVILDGVFSHTGDDSVYFNKYGNYDSVGAAQSERSPYYHWYRFTEYPNRYQSWWGFESLPEVDETQPDWIRFMITDGDSVVRSWILRGACGYRLDVADELPDETIEMIRAKIKHESQDNVLIGEVWEDATTKQSYGKNRTYALGRGLDSVMNYPLTAATVDFLLGKHDAYEYKRFLIGQSQNYPKEMYYALMNLLSSHDIARIRTVLGTRVDVHGLNREQQAHFVVTEEQDRQGAKLQRMAVAVQFSIPGVPCIYYGDENGMNGLLDPFNRRPYHEKDGEMREYHKKLATLRRDNDALKTGGCAFYAHSADILAILRFCIDGKDAFANMAKDGMFLTVLNRSEYPERAVIDLFAEGQLLTARQLEFFREVEFQYGVDVLNGKRYRIDQGLISIDMPPQSEEIIEILWI